MYPRNAASPERIAVGPVVQISDGAVQTSGVSVKVKPQGGSAAAGEGTISYEEGVVGYVPTQAETNHTSFQVLAYKTGCIPTGVTVVTSAASVPGTVVPADDSITASTFDESTAFPLKSADTGSTTVARTGAGADTLETLSGQMDFVALESTLTAIKGAGWTTETLAAMDVLLDAIKAKTDNLPSSPAAVGSEMTLTSAYDAAKTAATQASVNAIPTGDPMAAPMGDYEEGTAGYEIHELYEQVTAVLPDYPSVTVPAPPTAEQSTAWIRCLSQAGAPEAGVTITVRLVSVDAGVDAYDMAPASGTSDASGLATITIPRGAQCLFEARRGGTGRWVRFRGANAPTVLLPSVLGSP